MKTAPHEEAPLTNPRSESSNRSGSSLPPLELALRAAQALDAPVVPARGKRPDALHGYRSASRDPVEIRRLFAAAGNRATGYGIAADGLVLLDEDRPGALAELEARIGRLPATMRVRSGGGGRHVYLRLPGHLDFELNFQAAKFPAGLEAKVGLGSGLIGPGSRYPNGECYREMVPPPIAEAPGALLELLKRRPVPSAVPPSLPPSLGSTRYGSAALRRHSARVAAAQPGERRRTLNGAAYALGQLAGAGLLEAVEAADVLSQAALAAAVPLPALEVRRTVAAALRDGLARPWAPRLRSEGAGLAC
jgi:hypothetical protein